MSEQLVFDLPVRESRARGDFFVSEANQLAVLRLEDAETWPNRKLVLVGPEGAGKSHLASVWAENQGAIVMEPAALPGLDVTRIGQPVVVDGLPCRAQGEEEALFHLHNHMGTSLLPLLLVARTSPARWAITLPDLKSRMEATDLVHIAEPDDALLSAVLVKLFADRQVQVAPSLIGWLATRMNRSFAEAKRVVAELDTLSLANKGRITRKLAEQVLDKAP